MVNYSHAVIYRIINKETGENLYIGSTTDYNRRMAQHKYNCNNPNAEHYNVPIYKHIRELGGWEFVRHVMIEEFTTCQNKMQLIRREQELIDAQNATQNSVRAYRTEEQKKQQDCVKSKKYNDANKEKIKEYHRMHYLKKKNEHAELVQSSTL